MILVEFVPTYEYECPRCPRVFEVRQRITEPALTACDRCGGPIRRLLSATPFILKGGGWYVTNYPSESRKKATSSELVGSSPPAADSKASEAKGEAKSEAKAPDSSSKDSKPPKSDSSDSKSSTSDKPGSGSGSSSGGAKKA